MRSDKELWQLAADARAKGRALQVPVDLSRRERERIQRIGWDKEIEMRAEFARKRGRK
jgi:hypothetical protein